jgi:diaminohydroxyphosphoribosylaminopyrimidine deaminase/5-amino-6-(5-phosphoribosylamino)uracil reductase
MVGCLIVFNNNIVSEGFHQAFGGPHAEIEALKNLPSHIPISECVVYVNLEPCNHFGKTPPCSQALVKAGVKKVVVGMQDPFAQVNGSGLAYLRENGVEVISNVQTKECELLNRRFTTFHKQKRPYIILKWAQCANGFIGIKDEQTKISHWDAQQMLHLWRGQEAAIAIGKNTFLTDNPKLDTRHWPGKNPSKHVFWGNSPVPNNTDFNVISGTNPKEWMNHLYTANIQSVLIEGGAQILNAFIDNNLFDEVRIIKSKTTALKNGIAAPVAPVLDYKITELIQDDIWEGLAWNG